MTAQRRSMGSRQRGVSTVTILLVLAAAAGAYLAYVHVPVRMATYEFERELTKLIRAGYIDGRAPNEERLEADIGKLTQRLRLDVDPAYPVDATVDSETGEVQVRFTFTQTYRYPIVDKAYTRVTRVDRVHKRGD